MLASARLEGALDTPPDASEAPPVGFLLVASALAPPVFAAWEFVDNVGVLQPFVPVKPKTKNKKVIGVLMVATARPCLPASPLGRTHIVPKRSGDARHTAPPSASHRLPTWANRPSSGGTRLSPTIDLRELMY